MGGGTRTPSQLSDAGSRTNLVQLQGRDGGGGLGSTLQLKHTSNFLRGGGGGGGGVRGAILVPNVNHIEIK